MSYVMLHNLHREQARDRVDYALPLSGVSEIAHAAFVERELARIFDYRHAAATRLLG